MENHSRYDWGNPLSIVMVNMDAWNALSPGARAAVDKLAWELEPRFWEISEGLNDTNLAKLQDNGMDVMSPGPDLRAEILAAGERVWKQYLETAGPEATAVVEGFLARMGR